MAQSTPNPRRRISLLGPYKEPTPKSFKDIKVNVIGNGNQGQEKAHGNTTAKLGRIPKVKNADEIRYTEDQILSRGMNLEDFVERGGLYTKRPKEIKKRIGCGRQGQKREASDMTIIMPKRQRLDLPEDPDAVNLSTNFEDVDRAAGIYDDDDERVNYHGPKKVTGVGNFWTLYPVYKTMQNNFQNYLIFQNTFQNYFIFQNFFPPIKPIYKTVGVDVKIGEECKVVEELIIFYLLSGKTLLVNLSRFVNVVRKTYSIMKHCNFLYLFVKEEQLGRPKTLCHGMNKNQNATQKLMTLFNSILFHVFLLIVVNVFKFFLFFPLFQYLYFCSTFPILPISPPNHNTSKTPLTSSWLPLSNFPLVQTSIV